MVAGLLAAAAVVAIAFVAIRDDDPASPADQPSTTVTVPPTLPPQALFGPADAPLAPGTYFLDEVEGTPTPRILVTIGDGWSTFDDWGLTKDDGRPSDDVQPFPTEFSSTPATRAMGITRGRSTPWTGSSPR